VVRVGLVGYGYWGPNYARTFRETDRAMLTWVCDLSTEALRKAKERDPAVKVTLNLADVLNANDCDAVIVAVPTRHHFRVAERVLSARKPVLIEKPLAPTSEECAHLVELAKQSHSVAMVGHVYLYNPAVRYIAQRLRGGDLGAVRYISASRIGFSPKRDDVDALWDLSPHDVSMVLHFLQESPASVCAASHAYLRAGRADVVLALMQFPSGVVCDMQASWDTPFKHRDVTVVAERATIVFDDVASDKVKVYDAAKPGAPPKIPHTVAVEPLKAQLLHFLDCIESGTAPETTLEDGLRVVRVLEGLSGSMRSGRMVTLS